MKSKQFVLGSVILLIVLVLSACVKSQGPAVEVSCENFEAANHIAQQAEVSVGGLLTVALCSNPTTGFQWEEAKISDQTVLEETSHRLVSPGEDQAGPRVGGAGYQEWTFTALQAGQSVVSIASSRPWEGGEKGIWTFDLTVVVK